MSPTLSSASLVPRPHLTTYRTVGGVARYLHVSPTFVREKLIATGQLRAVARAERMLLFHPLDVERLHVARAELRVLPRAAPRRTRALGPLQLSLLSRWALSLRTGGEASGVRSHTETIAKP